jgi:hypothetical protein
MTAGIVVVSFFLYNLSRRLDELRNQRAIYILLHLR